MSYDKRGIRTVRAILLSAAATMVAGPAFAQTAAGPAQPPATNNRQVDEIIVTAQFRGQNLQDTPIAITAFTGEMLQARSQTSIAEIAAQAPNVSLRAQGGAYGSSIAASIRGVGQADQSPALEPGVGIYIDDVYFPTLTGAVFDLLDIDRAEILRGPQGTLAGRNSIGGAIKLYSKKPDSKDALDVMATYGSRNRLDLRAVANVAITDTLFARVAAVSKEQDGYVKRLDFGCVNPPGSALNPAVGGVQPTRSPGDCVVGKDGDVGYRAIRGQLRYAPSDAFEINIIGDYTHEKRNQAGLVAAYANYPAPWVSPAPAVPYDSRFLCGRYCNYANLFQPGGAWTGPVATGYPLNQFSEDNFLKLRSWGVSGQMRWQLASSLELTSITAYRKYTTDFTSDEDLSPAALSASTVDIDFHVFSQELRLGGTLGANDQLEYTIGGFYSDQRTGNGAYLDIRFTPFPFQVRQRDVVTADSKAAFAHVAWHPVDGLTLTGGIRYTKEGKDYLYRRTNLDGSPNPFVGDLNGATSSYKGNRVDYRANVQYAITPAVNIYAQFATGFKGGGVNPRPFVAAQALPFNPEKLQAYEIGLKSELFDRRARVNIAAFRNDYKNLQTGVNACPAISPPPIPCFLIVNAGTASIKGAELEISARPVEGLLIDGSLSYVDFKYGGSSGFSGLPPYTSKWKWSLGAQYAFALPGGSSLTPRVDAAYQSKTFDGPINGPTGLIPGYTLVNGRISWKNSSQDIEVSAEVTNIFDKYYYASGLDLSISGGYAQFQPGHPREWALSVRKKF